MDSIVQVNLQIVWKSFGTQPVQLLVRTCPG